MIMFAFLVKIVMFICRLMLPSMLIPLDMVMVATTSLLVLLLVQFLHTLAYKTTVLLRELGNQNILNFLLLQRKLCTFAAYFTLSVLLNSHRLPASKTTLLPSTWLKPLLLRPSPVTFTHDSTWSVIMWNKTSCKWWKYLVKTTLLTCAQRPYLRLWLTPMVTASRTRLWLLWSRHL